MTLKKASGLVRVGRGLSALQPGQDRWHVVAVPYLGIGARECVFMVVDKRSTTTIGDALHREVELRTYDVQDCLWSVAHLGHALSSS